MLSNKNAFGSLGILTLFAPPALPGNLRVLLHLVSLLKASEEGHPKTATLLLADATVTKGTLPQRGLILVERADAAQTAGVSSWLLTWVCMPETRRQDSRNALVGVALAPKRTQTALGHIGVQVTHTIIIRLLQFRRHKRIIPRKCIPVGLFQSGALGHARGVALPSRRQTNNILRLEISKLGDRAAKLHLRRVCPIRACVTMRGLAALLCPGHIDMTCIGPFGLGPR